MDSKTIQIIKSTAPIFKEHGETIIKKMYEIAFNERPEYRKFFENTHMKNQEEGHKQITKLATSIYIYANHIDKLEKLSDVIKHIAYAHVNTHVISEQYPVIGEYLLIAMQEVLGDVINTEIIEAWTKAYESLANILIKKEKEIYIDQEKEFCKKLQK